MTESVLFVIDQVNRNGENFVRRCKVFLKKFQTFITWSGEVWDGRVSSKP